jgi:hypothetical protein
VTLGSRCPILFCERHKDGKSIGSENAEIIAKGDFQVDFRVDGNSPEAADLLLTSSLMSRILREIMGAFPSLSSEFSSLPESEASDSRLMAELASHVVDLFESRQTEEILSAFTLTEHLIASGTESERNAAIIGFLETVQNVASHRECGSAAFEQYLGPMSEKAWAELTKLWTGKMSLADVVAFERGTNIRPRWWQFWRRRKRRSPQDLLKEVENPELRKIIEQITRE